MKKTILNLCLLIGAYSASAQVIFSEDFEASGNSIPAGWHQQLPSSIPTNKGWFFNTTFGGIMGLYVPNHTNYAFVNDYDNNASMGLNYDTLYTPAINLSAYSSVFISYDVWYYGGFLSSPGDYEIASIAGSTDGGLTWTQIDTVGCREDTTWLTRVYDLSAFGGKPNVMFAFTYTDLGNQANGEAVDNISIYAPIHYDMSVISDNMFYLCKTGNSYAVSGVIRNLGGTKITSLHLNYSVNGGPAITDNLSALSISPLTNYSFSHSTLWTPTTAGNYVIKIWADNLNVSNTDQVHSNDTLTAAFIVIDTLQTKMPLVEEFTQASCNPCMFASPNLDSVLYNNSNYCNAIRYHMSYPGRDFINNVTQINADYPRLLYYNIGGIPDARIDGIYDVYPGYVSSGDIQQAASLGSPFSITVNATYNPLTNLYSATASITAHAALPTGLRARAMITVDTIKYKNDQSIEDPPSSFAPPIGTGTTPDSYYPYVLNYPEVAEDFMPDANGVKLGAFYAGQTRVVNYSWTKNHAWSDSNKAWLYDSLNTHITVFIQNDSTSLAGGGAPNGYVYQTASSSVITGVENLTGENSSFEMYPNPGQNKINLTYKLSTEQNVTVEIYNLPGEKIFSEDKGVTSSGLHVLAIDTKGLANGMYFVRLYTGNLFSTKKLEKKVTLLHLFFRGTFLFNR